MWDCRVGGAREGEEELNRALILWQAVGECLFNLCWHSASFRALVWTMHVDFTVLYLLIIVLCACYLCVGVHGCGHQCVCECVCVLGD
jgi:hypothetical protein